MAEPNIETRVLWMLDVIAPDGISGSDGLVEEARPVFADLVERGLIKRVYVISDEGRAIARARRITNATRAGDKEGK